jgi:TonB family protein
MSVNPPIPSVRRPAKPRNNPGLWVSTVDYPVRSLHDEEEGTAGFRLTVGPDGQVKDCVITASSGYASLDLSTCSNVTRRARFDPARDADGNPTVGSYANRVNWRIPQGPSFARQIGFEPNGPHPTFGTYAEIDESNYPLEALEKGMRGPANLALSVGANGKVSECQVEQGSGYPLLNSKACEIARTWTFLPARDPGGKSVSGTARLQVKWVLPDAWREYQRTGIYPPKPPTQ